MSSLRSWIRATLEHSDSLDDTDDRDEAFARLVEGKAALKKLLPLVQGSGELTNELRDAIRYLSLKQASCVRASLTTSASNKVFGDALPSGGGNMVLLVLGCANGVHMSTLRLSGVDAPLTKSPRATRGGRSGPLHATQVPPHRSGTSFALLVVVTFLSSHA
jgi:hypothetical protein